MEMAAGEILLELKFKQVQIQTALRSFQWEGLALLFGEQQRVCMYVYFKVSYKFVTNFFTGLCEILRLVATCSLLTSD